MLGFALAATAGRMGFCGELGRGEFMDRRPSSWGSVTWRPMLGEKLPRGDGLLRPSTRHGSHQPMSLRHLVSHHPPYPPAPLTRLKTQSHKPIETRRRSQNPLPSSHPIPPTPTLPYSQHLSPSTFARSGPPRRYDVAPHCGIACHQRPDPLRCRPLIPAGESLDTTGPAWTLRVPLSTIFFFSHPLESSLSGFSAIARGGLIADP